MTITRKNQFEELIDNLIIDEVSGLDEEIRKTLEGLDVSKKRMAILSILDNDRDMFMKIKRMVDNNDVSAAEHIKNVVEMLRAYVVVGEREQKSHGEVFTPYFIISDMLNLVEDWSNPNLKFLDPCAGVGNFPAVIIERLMVGLIDIFPNEEDRYRHIVENMIYMVELQAKNAFLCLCAFDVRDEYELNIFHGSFLSEEFDNHAKDVWGIDSFSYVIQNPPYQELLSGGNRMRQIYNLFIEKSYNISNKVISIHPSRWMASQRELKDFRNRILSTRNVKTIVHFENSQDVFGKTVDIRGGIQYFLIDKSYSGNTEINGELVDLLELDLVPTNLKSFSLIKKVNFGDKNFSAINKSKMQFGIKTNDIRFSEHKEDGFVKCYVSKQKGFEKWIDFDLIKQDPSINSFKVITARAAGKGGDGFGNKFIGHPGEVWCESYIAFEVDSEKEAESLLSYMNTKFCNFMLGLRKNTQDIKPDTCKWIPLVPFDREWTDEMLFERFELTKEEIELILNS